MSQGSQPHTPSHIYTYIYIYTIHGERNAAVLLVVLLSQGSQDPDPAPAHMYTKWDEPNIDDMYVCIYMYVYIYIYYIVKISAAPAHQKFRPSQNPPGGRVAATCPARHLIARRASGASCCQASWAKGLGASMVDVKLPSDNLT